MTTNDGESRSLRVRVLDGPLRGVTVPVGRRLTIGRACGSDLQLVHDGISRQHAQIVVDDQGRHVLVDLESSNGTFVDRRRIRRHVLEPGCVFKILRSKLVFEFAPRVPTSEESGVFVVQPVDRRTFKPTTDYVAVDLPRPKATTRREADAPLAPNRARSSSGAAVQALGAERHRIVATRPDGSAYEHSLVDDIVELRALRASRLRGDTPSEEQHRRLEILRDRLSTPTSGPPSRRRLGRFACHFPAKLRFASGHELSVAVLDLGVDGAKLRAYGHEVGHGEIIWLALYLVSRGRPHTVVFTGRVEWTRSDELGLSFSGAPGWEERAMVRRRMPTPHLEATPQPSAPGGMVLGRVMRRIHPPT